MCKCVCVYNACKSQKRTSNHLKLQLQVHVSHPTWMLQTEFGSNTRAVLTLNCWAKILLLILLPMLNRFRYATVTHPHHEGLGVQKNSSLHSLRNHLVTAGKGRLPESGCLMFTEASKFHTLPSYRLNKDGGGDRSDLRVSCLQRLLGISPVAFH